MNKSVLLITPYFAPQTHAPVFRFHKLAKYLHRFGWQPSILTVDRDYVHNEDPGMLDDLPPDLAIHRVRYIEPTLRGLRMAVGGRDRTFAGLKGSEVATGNQQTSSFSDRLKAHYGRLLTNRVYSPDQYWTWVRPATNVAIRLIRSSGIQAVITTALPYSCHSIGLKLQEATGCRWIADFRDPGTYSLRTRSDNPRVFALQRAIELATLKNADAVTTVANSYATIFGEMYGPVTKRPIRFISSGLDEELLDVNPVRPSNIPGPYVVYSGEFLPEYDVSFFRHLAAIRDSGLRDCYVVIAGHRQINEAILGPVIQLNGLANQVIFLDQLPQRKLYSLLHHSQAGLLLNGRASHSWTCFAKMVDYVALRKPVLASVPDPSEARTTLSRTGLGVFMDGSDDQIRNRIISCFADTPTPLAPEQDAACNQYTARSQVASFAAVLDAVVTP